MAGNATKSLLIVEDNDVTREGLAVILRGNGYSTREFARGDEAMESLRTARPDLILLDMLLPGSGDDGWVVLDKLRRSQQWRSIPVIIVTGISVASEQWATALGAQGFLPKPIDTDELLLKIKGNCP